MHLRDMLTDWPTLHKHRDDIRIVNQVYDEGFHLNFQLLCFGQITHGGIKRLRSI